MESYMYRVMKEQSYNHWSDIIDPDHIKHLDYKSLEELIADYEQRDPIDWVGLNQLEMAHREIADRLGAVKEKLNDGETV